MIKRSISEQIKGRLFKNKAIIITGARQTGKTTLLKELLADTNAPHLYFNADDPEVREQLKNASIARLRQLIGNYKLVAIDEAQRVENIGLCLKLLVDQFPEVQVIATGSSALDMANKISEPLTGRKWEYHLYPISWKELSDHTNVITARSQLEQRLLFGMYPDVINNPGEEKKILTALTDSYLYKDLLSLDMIRKPDLLSRLLKAIAFQLGQEVSYNELSNMLEVDKKTIMTYLDLLEKTFVIFRLQSLSRKLRNEINAGRKIFFYDNGVRNALIANFSPIELRQDVGALWENFLVSERLKFIQSREFIRNIYFWRTYSQQEIDYIEEYDGKLYGFEFKWNKKASPRFPKTFMKAYPDSELELITSENFFEFVAGK